MQPHQDYKKLLEVISADINLPSPPAIAVKILDSVRRDDAALNELGTIIASDPALTARMLKVANNGIFMRNGEIANINRAMTVLGTNLIKNIALSFIISEDLGKESISGFNIDDFWKRSVTTAVAAELLARKAGNSNEDLFVAALLSDIGSLILALSKGDAYCKLYHEADFSDQSFEAIEYKHFGFSHCQVGYTLLSSWNLPVSICEPILFRSNYDQCSPEHRRDAQIISYAGRLADICLLNQPAQKARLLQQELSTEFLFASEEVYELYDETATASCAMLESFDLDASQIRPYSTLLEEANKQLGELNISNEQMLIEMNESRQRAEALAGKLQEANKKLRGLVYRDGLTGLYNHRFFHESLHQEFNRARRYQGSVSLILFDIDHFKQVNDKHGHPAGDQVLISISRAVNTAVRPSDIVARYGGEEFAVILPETNAAGANVFAARLRRCVEGIATMVDGQLIYVTISAGTTTFSSDCDFLTPDVMIAAADRGLYQAKEQGRNKVVALEPEQIFKD